MWFKLGQDGSGVVGKFAVTILCVFQLYCGIGVAMIEKYKCTLSMEAEERLIQNLIN